MALVEPYRRARLTSFLDPFSDAGDTGFQAVQALTALGSGGLFGVGLGESVQKIFYLPEAHTDMILAIIGEELGLVGILAVISLYGMIAYAGLRTAKLARDLHSRLLAAGITSLILCQATLNFFAVLGMAPLTGVPLPFLSYGSTNLLVLMGGMGLLLNVAATGGRAAARRASRAWRRSRGVAMPKVVIAAGGTAGHVVPALAVADALRSRGAEVEFVGGERAEAELVPAAGYPLHRVRVRGIDRRNPLKAGVRASRSPCAPPDARAGCCAPPAPTWCSAGGGYVAGPGGARGPLAAAAARAHRGGQPPRRGQPAARAARRAGCSCPSRSRAATGGRYVVTRAAGAGAAPGRSTRRTRAGASTSRRTCRACSCSAARSAPAG